MAKKRRSATSPKLKIQVELDEDLVLKIRGAAGTSKRRTWQVIDEAVRDYFRKHPFLLPGERLS